MQGTGFLVDYNKLDLVVNLHTEADFGEGCVPVCGKLGLLRVKPSLPSVKVKGRFFLPKGRIIMVCILLEEKNCIVQMRSRIKERASHP